MRQAVHESWTTHFEAAPPEPVPERMTAAIIDAVGGVEQLHLGEVDTPRQVNSEFIVRVVAAGVNPLDAKTRAGRGVSASIESFPAVLGMDFSGVVVRAPYEAHPLHPGTEVYGMVPFPRTSGSYAQYVTVPSLSLARKPAALSHVEAAGVPVAALTAWGMVVEVAKAHEGQRILVHAGSGGVGHFAVQFAKYFGAHVIATGSARNRAWLHDLGASEFVDYEAERFEDVVTEVDVVIDLVGNVHDDTGTRSLSILRPGGVIVNAPTGSWPTFLDEVHAAGVRGTTYKVAPDGNTLSTVSRLLESGDVRVFVDQVFDLGDAAAAHAALETGHSRGKIVLHVADS